MKKVDRDDVAHEVRGENGQCGAGHAVEEATLACTDPSSPDPRGARLSGTDLSGTDASGTDPSGPDPSSPDPRGARLSGTDASGPDLSGPDPSGARLSSTDASGPDPSDAGLRARLGGRHLTRRLFQLYAGLVAYGVSMALFVRSDLGNMPWDVFHQGLVVQLGGTIGRWSILVGALVLLLWIPLRERPGLGTVSNVFVIGLSIDATLVWLPEMHHLVGRVGYASAGVLLNAVATAAYIGARFGPGPRDGLMTGFTRRTRLSLRLVRTTIEVLVVLTGWLLGGTLGIATVAYAVTIGPLVQLMLDPFTVPQGPRSRRSPVPPVEPIGPDTLAA